MRKTLLPWSPGTDPSALILDALDTAIAVCASKQQRYALANGVLASEKPRGYTYCFTLVKSDPPPIDANLVLESRDFDKLQVEISTLAGTSVTLVVTQRLPERTLERATLLADPAWLLKQLKGALEHQLSTSLIESVLFGVHDPRKSIPEHLVDMCLDDLLNGVFTPDDYQRRTIERSLREELLLIIGPPGTGKTDVLAATAMAHLFSRSEPRVLVLAHTNIALDNAMERLVAFCQKAGGQSRLDDRRLIRLGRPSLTVLTGETYKSVVAPLILDEELRFTRLEIDQVKQKLDHIRMQLTANQQEERLLDDAWSKEQARLEREIEVITTLLKEQCQSSLKVLNEKRHAVTALKQQCIDAEAHTIQIRNTARLATQQRIQIEQALRQRQAMAKMCALSLEQWKQKTVAEQILSRLYAWIFEKSVDYQQMFVEARALLEKAEIALSTAREIERQWVEAYTQAFQQFAEARQRRDLAQKKLEETEASALAVEIKLEKDRSCLAAEYEVGEARITSLRTTIASQVRETGALEETLAYLDNDLAAIQRDLSRDLVDHAQLVGATLTNLFLSPHLLRQHWDVIIVDEVSMVQIPTIQLAARCADSHLILIGDPNQLAPVCQFEQEDIRFWLGQDIYNLCHYTIDDADRGKHSCALLPYQSRMHPEICDLIRGPIYHDLLRDRSPQPLRLQLAPHPDSPVVLYDTSGQSHAERPQGGSRQNRVHADLVVRLIEEMLASLDNIQPECIGVVTPYKAQVRLIKEVLQKRNLQQWVRIGTVHTFQGLEFVGVIFDTGDAPGLSLSPFTSGKEGSEAMRLINVAITRARDKLVLVANLDYQLQAPAHYIMPQVLRVACTKRCVQG